VSVTKQDTQGDFERESGEGMKGELVLLIEGSFFSRGNVIRTGFRNPKVNVLSPSQPFSTRVPYRSLFENQRLARPSFIVRWQVSRYRSNSVRLLELLLIRRLRRTHRSGGRRKGTTHSVVSATTAMLKN